MPVYQLLGGKSRFAVDCYAHASGNTPEEVAEGVQKYIAQGFRHVRIQQGGYGGTGTLTQEPDFKKKGERHFYQDACNAKKREEILKMIS